MTIDLLEKYKEQPTVAFKGIYYAADTVAKAITLTCRCAISNQAMLIEGIDYPYPTNDVHISRQKL